MRNHEEGFRFLYTAYPDMTQDEQADLIEKGELKIVAPIKEPTELSTMWADETREEAQRPKYKEILIRVKELLSNGSYRIVS